MGTGQLDWFCKIVNKLTHSEYELDRFKAHMQITYFVLIVQGVG